jgi:DNA excision repair protein ERCC-2
MNALFPHDEVRNIQQDLMNEITSCLKAGTSLVAHAPTGLGKTAASIAPAITYALENGKTLFFLTSRHTQHKIAMDTLRKIKEKHNKDFIVSDIIGKKHMCLQPGVQTLYSSEFFDYCKALREDGRCDFYTNTYTKDNQDLSIPAKKIFNELAVSGTQDSKQIIATCEGNPGFCPYEMSQQLAKKARVIIADYYYIFDPGIQLAFFNRTNKTMEDSIIIIDEAHNLPERIRELMTVRLTTFVVERAIQEAKQGSYDEAAHYLTKIQEILQNIMANTQGERLV